MKSIIKFLRRKRKNYFNIYLGRNKVTKAERKRKRKLFSFKMFFMLFILILLIFVNLIELLIKKNQNNKDAKYYELLEETYKDGKVIEGWTNVQVLANVVAKCKTSIVEVQKEILNEIKSETKFDNIKVTKTLRENDEIIIDLETEMKVTNEKEEKKVFEITMKFDHDKKDFIINDFKKK